MNNQHPTDGTPIPDHSPVNNDSVSPEKKKALREKSEKVNPARSGGENLPNDIPADEPKTKNTSSEKNPMSEGDAVGAFNPKSPGTETLSEKEK